MTINSKSAQRAEIAIELALNEKLYQDGIITRVMYEYAKSELLKR